MSAAFWETNLIYQVIAGSQAYGLDTPESDLDLRGVCIPPRRYLLGLSSFEQWEQQDESGDVVIYALEKFARLALACNHVFRSSSNGCASCCRCAVFRSGSRFLIRCSMA